ncbi:MAG: 4-hydroxy-tetrahydrodipicolinate reductase [Marinifilaceae bacterium]|jgi:4-hydroxy-tetrahydrodipicolinate reductase|nr:4-hydroxy-tetrahydrodipicolinate reductase [Marinifilaceae bacterium]
MNIGLIGFGKMGKSIKEIATERGHEIKLIIDKNNTKDLTVENLKKLDVVIEFTTPSTAFDNYIKCAEAGVPVVSGTTGWLDKMDEIKKHCVNGFGFFYASNFSLGVNLFFELNKKLAKMMNRFKQYDVDMEEIHHIHKLDSPSGTAISLAEGIIENTDHKNTWTEGLTDKEDSIDIFARRNGAVAGTHKIKWHSEQDEICISHKAYNRTGFSTGAVIAAEFMKGKQGFYQMNDLLEL